MQKLSSQPLSMTTPPSKIIPPQQRHLNDAQYRQLRTVLHETFIMDPFDSYNFPKLYVDPCSLILTVQQKLQNAGIRVTGAGIVGGAASYVLAKEAVSYADLDLLVQVDFPVHQHHEKFNTIRTCTLEILRDAFYKQTPFVSPGINAVGLETLSRMYVLKMMKIPQIHQTRSMDYWSLICFRNREGRNIELKFEHTMHRAYEFSSHSFVIYLNDSFLQKHARCDCTKGEIGRGDLINQAELAASDSQSSDEKSSDSGDTPNTNTDNELDQAYIDEDGYVEDSGSSTGSSNPPSRRNSLSTGYTNDDAHAWGVEPFTDKTNIENNMNDKTESRGHEPVVVESYYINFDEAVKHLNKRQICVYKPQEIRGGGFLKYCHLMFRGWTHLGQDGELRATELDIMATRFSIDFQGDAAVWRALKCYVDCHFWRDRESVCHYLDKVRQIYSRTNVSNKTPLISLIESIFMRHNQYLAFHFAATFLPRTDTGSS